MTTYAYIDVIGVKKLLHSRPNNAVEMLKNFWNKMNIWANNDHKFICRKLDQPNELFSPSIYVDVWSDSALIHCEPEVYLEDFYDKILSSIKLSLVDIPFFCVVCSGEEIEARKTSVLGGLLSSSGTRPYWHQVAGSGPVWINLWTAIEELNNMEDWHKKYSLYAVGKESIWIGHKREEKEILDWQGKSIILFACDWEKNNKISTVV